MRSSPSRKPSRSTRPSSPPTAPSPASPADLLAAHRAWADLHEAPHKPSWPVHANDRTPNRRLRIGYVSPDFRSHSVSYFLEPILDHHDPEQFEIIGYAQVPNPDVQTW